MRDKFKRITAFLMSIVMLAGTFAVLAISGSAASVEEEVKKGEFIFAPHTYTEGDLSDIYYYTDAVFSGSAFEYNEHLATMSMILASASISSQDYDVSYDFKSRNLNYLFREWDFMCFDVNEEYKKKPGEQTMGVGIAHKIIGEGDDAFTLLAIVPRSAGYEKEWAGNFTVGKEGVHQGFATGRDIILDFAKKYVEENADLFEGTVKVWTVGYSRGAGVANLLAAYLDDNSEALGVNVEKENIFAYTFGTPSNVEYKTEEEKAALASNYKNIHNRYSEYDIVTYAPFKDWNFTYYGTTKLFDVHNAEAKAEMLKFLEKTNQTIYDIYTAEGSSADPDNFMPLMVQLSTGEEGVGLGLVPADPAYGIPTNQKDFLDSRIAFLVDKLVPDRETYVEFGYEYALQCLTSLYFGLDEEQKALLIEGMSHDVKLLAASYYCYYLSDYYMESEEFALTALSVLNSTLPIIEGSIAELEASGDSTSQEYAAYVREFIQSEAYLELKRMLELVTSDPDMLSLVMLLAQETFNDFVIGMTGKVLGNGVNALTIDEEEKAKLYETITSYAVTARLTDFFVYLLLGSDEPIIEPFSLSNKNISLAITFLANAGRYMRVHNNEIILSWLRTEDSYYKDEDWHVHTNDLIYDENGHWEACECGYKTEMSEHMFGEWSTIPVNRGDKEVLFRRCHCGFEEVKDWEATEPDTKPLDATTVVILICVGVVIIAVSITTIAIVNKKRKHK